MHLRAALPLHHAVVPWTPRHQTPRARTPLLVREDVDESLFPSIDSSKFRCGTIEDDDLEEVVEVLLDGFYKDILTLAASEFSEAELEVMRPALSVFNGFFKKLTRSVLLFETTKRIVLRLPRGGIERGESVEGALMIALQERASGEIVAVADLSEQPRDGKVPGDFRFPRPWSRLTPWATRPSRVAYICNLAVLEKWRGQGLGTSLLRSCEKIARERWDFSEVYLHAATAKPKLLAMYGQQGYDALPDFDQPGWILALAGREQTRYHVKALTDETVGRTAAATVDESAAVDDEPALPASGAAGHA